MAYATQNDLLQRVTLAQLTQLTDDAKTGSPSAAVVSSALEEASGLVEAYCRGRYVTPLQMSDAITSMVRDICVYSLFSSRLHQMPSTVRQRYEDAIALLKDISSGKAALDQPTSASGPQAVATDFTQPTQTALRITDDQIVGFV